VLEMAVEVEADAEVTALDVIVGEGRVWKVESGNTGADVGVVIDWNTLDCWVG